MTNNEKLDELIEFQTDWIYQLNQSLIKLKEYRSGKLKCSPDHFERLLQEHRNLADAVRNISLIINGLVDNKQ